MKRLFLFSALVLGGVFTLSAQEVSRPQTSASVGRAPIQAGNWMVGGALGSLGYGFESESFNINLNPRAGYFISDGIVIGLGANLGFATHPDTENDWTYSVAPFVRYFFPEGASSTGRFFGQVGAGIGGSRGGSGVSFAGDLGLGYAHFITESVALEAVVGYNYSKAGGGSATA
ncbi:hypothetical protein [Olivibacter sitiensis]|uniref:hypothetical protein n=1 Tax=Olivibacter sitiensis TaxID=376470 RepID=UPI000424568A|nr:hypothetical protein [Olivibacter sitiensis]